MSTGLLSLQNNRIKFQSHPYHLVNPSPWPLALSFTLLILTVSTVMYLHGFQYGGELVLLGIFLLSTGMSFWLRDVIVEE